MENDINHAVTNMVVIKPTISIFQIHYYRTWLPKQTEAHYQCSAFLSHWLHWLCSTEQYNMDLVVCCALLECV